MKNEVVFASLAAYSSIGQRFTRDHVTEPLLVFSRIFQMWEGIPFTTTTINGTCSVDGFGYAPQFLLLCFLLLLICYYA